MNQPPINGFNFMDTAIRAETDDYKTPGFDSPAATFATVTSLLLLPTVDPSNPLFLKMILALSQDSLLYDGTIGPLFCTLPYNFQQNILMWFRMHVQELSRYSKEVENLLIKSRNLYSTPSFSKHGFHALHSLIATVLMDFSPLHVDLVGNWEEETPIVSNLIATLQSDLLLMRGSNLYSTAINAFNNQAIAELVSPYMSKSSHDSQGDHVISAQSDQLKNEGNEENYEDLMRRMMPDSFTGGKTNFSSMEMGMDFSPFPVSSFLGPQTHSNMGSSSNSQMINDVDVNRATSANDPKELSQDDYIQMNNLLDYLRSLDSSYAPLEQSLPPEIINWLINSPHLELIIQGIEWYEMSDETILNFLQPLFEQEKSPTKISILISNILLPKLSSINATASRAILSVTYTASSLHPRVVISSLIIPIMFQNQFNAFQSELFTRVIKDQSSELQFSMTKDLLSFTDNSASWNMNVIDMFGKLITIKPQWSQEMAHTLIKQLHEHMDLIASDSRIGEKTVTLIRTLLQRLDGKWLIPSKSLLQQILARTKSSLADKITWQLEALK